MPRSHALVTSLLLLTGGTLLSAVEVGPPGSGLQIGGFGEAIVRGEHHDARNPKNSQAGTPGAVDEDDIDFSADALLKASYKVDQFSLRLEVFISNEPQFNDAENDGNNVILEQAFVDWKFHDRATLRAGRFLSTWIGWEGYHSPDLFRVNNSAVWSWNVRDHGQLENRPFLSDGTLRDYKRIDGSSGYYQNARKVYNREDEPCTRCDAKIKRIKIGGRSSYFCPKCQK